MRIKLSQEEIVRAVELSLYLKSKLRPAAGEDGYFYYKFDKEEDTGNLYIELDVEAVKR